MFTFCLQQLLKQIPLFVVKYEIRPCCESIKPITIYFVNLWFGWKRNFIVNVSAINFPNNLHVWLLIFFRNDTKFWVNDVKLQVRTSLHNFIRTVYINKSKVESTFRNQICFWGTSIKVEIKYHCAIYQINCKDKHMP